MKARSLFISHSWTYGDAYDRLVDLMNAAPRFLFKNYSVPKGDPIHNAPGDKLLYEAIKRQIAPTQVVLILAGVYATYSKWIDKEIQIAKTEFPARKPIIAIEPWRAERTSQKVKGNADMIVSWNTSSLVTAIRQLVL